MQFFDDALLAPVRAFQQELKVSEFQPPVLCGEQAFPLLLAGIPALRRTPGLTPLEELGADYFTSIPFCRDGEQMAVTRQHLEEVYGYTDKDSLMAFCLEELQINRQYLDFESFWENRPAFDMADLTEEAREVFTACSDFARLFQPFVGRRGFLAWDISETLGHLRAACACQIITKDEFTQLAAPLAEQASAFRSWNDYALCLVCAGAYWAFRMGSSPEEVSQYIDLNIRLTQQLLKDKRAWCGRMWWRKPGQKALRLSAAELRPLLTGWDGPAGCLASDRIVVDGRPVGYCYRETPMEGVPDSGWRFLAGDEGQEYLEDPARCGIYHLNTICNYDPEIIPLLTAPGGSTYVRGENGRLMAMTDHN